jgi:lipoprotein signal peptidase
LGHVVGVKESHLDPKKISTVKNFPILKFVTNVGAFLGFTSSYKKFILGYSKIVKPMFGLTKKDDKFLWTPIY